MKKIMIYLFAITCLSQAYSQVNDCTTPICYGGSCDCQVWSDWEQRTIMTQFPDFPECTLMVTYCYRQCLDPENWNCVEIYIKGIQAIAPDCGDCSRFFAWLETGQDEIKARKVRGVFIFFYRYIIFTEWADFIGALDPEDYPYCDQGVRKKFFYRRASCMAFCKTQYPIGQPNTLLLITPKECEEAACCVKRIELCVDRLTIKTLSWEYMESIPPVYCEPVLYPPYLCPPGANVTSTICKDDCTED